MAPYLKWAKCSAKPLLTIKKERRPHRSALPQDTFTVDSARSLVMVMSRWDPFSEALSLRDAMNRLFEQAVWHPAFEGGQRSDGGFSPALDVRETSDEYFVDASLPGVDPKDVSIELEQGVLTIQGEIHEERREQEPQSGAQARNGGQGQTTGQHSGRYHLRERRFGRFF